MSDRNAIAQELTVEQLDAFVTALAGRPGKERTLAAIKHMAAEHGITISLMSAKAFRDTTFERHLEKLRVAQEVALQVERIEQGGNTLADAGAKLLSQRIFNRLLDAQDEDSASYIDEDATALNISRLRKGDVAKRALEATLRESEAKVRALEAREREREEKSKAASQELEKLRDPKSGLSDEDRAAIVATVDGILGLKVTRK